MEIAICLEFVQVTRGVCVCVCVCCVSVSERVEQGQAREPNSRMDSGSRSLPFLSTAEQCVSPTLRPTLDSPQRVVRRLFAFPSALAVEVGCDLLSAHASPKSKFVLTLTPVLKSSMHNARTLRLGLQSINQAHTTSSLLVQTVNAWTPLGTTFFGNQPKTGWILTMHSDACPFLPRNSYRSKDGCTA